MEEKVGTGGVRVATLNLWGRRGAWDERQRVLVEGFRKLRPDLVAFQEAVVGDGYDQVIDLLGPGYHVAHQTEREVDRAAISRTVRAFPWPAAGRSVRRGSRTST